jgi:hypothetical protein
MGLSEWPSLKIEPGSLLQDMLLTAIAINKPRSGLPANKFKYIRGILSFRFHDHMYIGLISEWDIEKCRRIMEGVGNW